MSRSVSRAHQNFESAIEDACALLSLIDSLYKLDPTAPTAEVLKRAGLVMSLTAWETYVEDRVTEAVNIRLKAVSGSSIGKFVSSRLSEELKRFHNPNSEKTRRIFLDYLEVDVTTEWKWLHFEPATARKMLDDLLAKRGEAVHRSKPIAAGGPAPHLVRREELDKAIRFLKGLVEATDKALAEH